MFYVKLAITNLKKNKRAYIPFLLSMIFLVVVNVVMQVMLTNKGMSTLPSAGAAKSLFGFGSVVIMIFTVIFSLYTNSFLLKQRKKELGLYNILGMGKKELAKILFIESIFSSTLTIIIGLITGVVFSKLSFLVLKKMTGFGAQFTYSLDTVSIAKIVAFFMIIFLILYLITVIQLKMVNPLSLLQGEQHGEKEPKAKWLTALVGVSCIGIGYGISLSIKTPLSAISLFFVAVVLVIIGTYALFTASSIVILKLLKRNKRYYYQPNHFISVSSMMYRMKQNAVGLASICILSTMVLVTVATTASLYFGMDNMVKNRNPYDVSVTVTAGKNEQKIADKMQSLAKEHEVMIDEENTIQTTTRMMLINQGTAFKALSMDEFRMNDAEVASMASFMTQAEFGRLTGDKTRLDENELMLYSMNKPYKEKKAIFGDQTYDVVKTIDEMTFIPRVEGLSNAYIFVFENQQQINKAVQSLYPIDFAEYQQMDSTIYVNTSGTQANQLAYAKAVKNMMSQQKLDEYTFSSQAIDREESQGFMGGFLFLGLVFGLTFTLATGIIIYYKQISEGTQDKYRYDIMQRVGMSRDEVKRTIRSQVLMVFFFPIALATLHLVFAFPLISKMLLLFGLSDQSIFLIASVIVVTSFLVIYLMIFGQTSKAYYRIVERKN
ncbi:hypothetical protein CBF34_03670 [Vagococcus penaei]|uniref:FtsX-like permease family protein n=2 Tax=Vagococcus penaei TaxID=633807 RepID=UPI000F88A8A7|nr:ABC transporter permease [Vagococcus penaei]RSU05865.1 hypothetical protein CBF34_03670 [Vagococcus penaei]